MEKCINTYFLYGDEIKLCDEFKDYYIDTGKSLYEVIRISDRIPIFLMEHIERLYNSAEIIKYNLSINKDEIIDRILNLININNIAEGNIKIVINCGSDEGFLAYFIAHSYPKIEDYAEGVKTITYNEERSNPNAKVINSEFRQRVNAKISSKDAYEAILVDNAGIITEGSRSNIFMVIDSMVVTSKVEKVLPGITRQFIIKVCKKLNIKFEEKNIPKNDIEKLSGLFISGTSPKVLPIKSVDNIRFNSAKNIIINTIMTEFEVEISINKQSFINYMQNRTINK